MPAVRAFLKRRGGGGSQKPKTWERKVLLNLRIDFDVIYRNKNFLVQKSKLICKVRDLCFEVFSELVILLVLVNHVFPQNPRIDIIIFIHHTKRGSKYVCIGKI